MPAARIVKITLVGLLVAAAIVWGYWPRPILVDVAAVRVAPLEVSVEEEGRTRVKDRFVISAPVSGHAQRLELRVGDAVSRTQPVARLEPLRSEVLDPRRRAQAEARVAAAQFTLAAAESKVRGAKADSDYAHNEYQRMARLWDSRNISQETLEAARTTMQRAAADLRSAQFAVEVARHELEAARTALAYSAASDDAPLAEIVTVRSPVAGRVLRLHRESEGVIQAGQPLIEVGDPAALEVEVDLLSADAVRVAPGTPVRFDRWGGEGQLTGAVRLVEPTGFTKISALGVEEQRVLVIVDITSPRPLWERLGDGYRVEASFVVWRQEQVLQVPASALFRHRDGWAVFVIEAGVARRRAVQTGQQNGLIAQVRAGLEAGESVVLHPDDSVSDGTRVRTREAG